MVVTGMGQIGLEYTDPAIMLGAQASRASDIWSLGASLHFAATGVGVYGDLPTREPLLLVRSILASSPTIRPEVTPGLASLIAACVHADLAMRPPTAADVATAEEPVGMELHENLYELGLTSGRGVFDDADLLRVDGAERSYPNLMRTQESIKKTELYAYAKRGTGVGFKTVEELAQRSLGFTRGSKLAEEFVQGRGWEAAVANSADSLFK
eukprot:gene2206-2587_t